MFQKCIRLFRMIILKIRLQGKCKLKGVPFFEKNTRIRIKKGSLTIGYGFHFRSGSYIAIVCDGKMEIGNSVFVNRNCSFVCQDFITIGDNCAFGPNVVIYDHDHKFGRNGIESDYKTAPIVIENNCWIGAGVIILRGTYIGEGSVIGAGTVLKGKIPPHSLVTSQGNRELCIVPIKDET